MDKLVCSIYDVFVFLDKGIIFFGSRRNIFYFCLVIKGIVIRYMS